LSKTSPIDNNLSDERYAFLELEPADSALLIGAASPGLARFVSRHFRRLTLTHWDKGRLKRLAPLIPGKVETLLVKPGELTPAVEPFDMILSLWSAQYLGEAETLADRLWQSLKPSGCLLLVESADRPMNEAQSATRAMQTQTLTLAAEAGWSIHPPVSSDRWREIVRSGGFSSIRLRVFTEPGLLADPEEWESEREAISAAREALPADKHGLPDSLERAMTSPGCATPPFFLLSAVKVARESTVFTTRASIPAGVEPAVQPEMPETLALITPLPTPSESKTATPEPAATVDAPRLIRKLQVEGMGKLRDRELFAIAWAGGSEAAGLALARRLFDEYGAGAIAAETNPGRLAEELSLPLEDACRIVALFALGRRCTLPSAGEPPRIRSAEEAFGLLQDLGQLKKEHLRGLYLNIQNRLVRDEVISIGTLTSAVVQPRDVFAPALECAAGSVILAHNHPSGDPKPSPQDIALTQQLAQAGAILGIELLDHLIIAGERFVSMKREGYL